MNYSLLSRVCACMYMRVLVCLFADQHIRERERERESKSFNFVVC